MATDRRAAAMTVRKGEITLPEIKRKWPHHVALPADKVRGVMNSNIVWGFAATLSAGPRPYFVRDGGDDLVVSLASATADIATAIAAGRR